MLTNTNSWELTGNLNEFQFWVATGYLNGFQLYVINNVKINFFFLGFILFFLFWEPNIAEQIVYHRKGSPQKINVLLPIIPEIASKSLTLLLKCSNFALGYYVGI